MYHLQNIVLSLSDKFCVCMSAIQNHSFTVVETLHIFNKSCLGQDWNFPVFDTYKKFNQFTHMSTE